MKESTASARHVATMTEMNNDAVTWGASIAQWIRERLPSYHPGFESQPHLLHFL